MTFTHSHPSETIGRQTPSAALQAQPGCQDRDGSYRSLVEQLPLVSYIKRLNGDGATYVSPQILGLTGYTAEEAVADPKFFERIIHPAHRACVSAKLAELDATGGPFVSEYRVVARNGRHLWVHDAATAVRDADGTPLYVQGYLLNIDDRKGAEAAQLASDTELDEQLLQSEHRLLHDPLTGLANRTLFLDRTEKAIQAARRSAGSVAVILFDLDRFKQVNDSFGHSWGDALLVEIAARLQGALREQDSVARLEGDEFGVLALGIADPVAAQAIAEKLHAALARPFALAGITYEAEASVGIALFPEHGTGVDALVRHAEVAVCVSKNTHAPTVYTAEPDKVADRRLALVSELGYAINGNELVIEYQPEVDAASGEIHKVEALVRWQHPEFGLLGPDQFVPIAEETGLIRALTRHVLDAALGLSRSWKDEGRDLTVAVNITSRELVDLDFPNEVAGLLSKWNVEPNRLELEITERTVMTDLPRSRSILNRLAELGVRVAIDDFGSGQTSLSYLRGLPLSVLKIDKSFVQRMVAEPENAALVRMAIDLGHNLGLEVVAEGVETELTKRQLEDLGCDTLQGYYLGRPARAWALPKAAAPPHGGCPARPSLPSPRLASGAV